MKVYVCLNALPWEEFKLTIQDPTDATKTTQIQAHSSATNAGFLPLFWSEEQAKATFPGHAVQVADVADDWHPMLNRMRAEAAATEAQEEIAIDTAVDMVEEVEMPLDSSEEEVVEITQ